MNIPVLDLTPIHEALAAPIEEAILRVVRSQQFIMGPDVAALESEMADFLGGSVHCIACANGSDALILAMLAFGIGPGDEVIVPAFTFVSTATSVQWTGATPVFADIDADSFNLSVNSTIEQITSATRAVIPVHLFGRPADVHELRLALDNIGRDDILILEDAAQGLGARLDNAPVCTIGDAGTISFFPSKNLGCFGDGGMVAVRDAAVATRLRMLTQHGSRVKYFNELIGYNSRLDSIQAAILRVKLPHLRAWCDERRANAEHYRALFASASLRLGLPADDGSDGRFHPIYNQFTIRVGERDALQQYLKEKGIGTMVYYPRTLAEQPCFAALRPDLGAVPVSTAACREVLSLPIYPGLAAEAREAVVEAIGQWMRAGA